MRLTLEDFEEKNFIGDWAFDKTIKVDKETILEDICAVKYAPEEFSFHAYALIDNAINFRGFTSEELSNALAVNLDLEELQYRIYKLKNGI